MTFVIDFHSAKINSKFECLHLEWIVKFLIHQVHFEIEIKIVVDFQLMIYDYYEAQQ